MCQTNGWVSEETGMQFNKREEKRDLVMETFMDLNKIGYAAGARLLFESRKTDKVKGMTRVWVGKQGTN